MKAPPLSSVWSRTIPAIFLADLLFFCAAAPAQHPQQPVAPVPAEQSNAPAQKPPSSGESSSAKKKDTKVPPFVIIGTVFDEKAMAFPGLEVRVRLKGDKKFKWNTFTNSRGEFAVRVPEGPDYEVVVQVKHYQDVSRFLSANGGVIQEQLSIRMKPVSQEKTGTKK